MSSTAQAGSKRAREVDTQADAGGWSIFLSGSSKQLFFSHPVHGTSYTCPDTLPAAIRVMLESGGQALGLSEDNDWTVIAGPDPSVAQFTHPTLGTQDSRPPRVSIQKARDMLLEAFAAAEPAPPSVSEALDMDTLFAEWTELSLRSAKATPWCDRGALARAQPPVKGADIFPQLGAACATFLAKLARLRATGRTFDGHARQFVSWAQGLDPVPCDLYNLYSPRVPGLPDPTPQCRNEYVCHVINPITGNFPSTQALVEHHAARRFGGLASSVRCVSLGTDDAALDLGDSFTQRRHSQVAVSGQRSLGAAVNEALLAAAEPEDAELIVLDLRSAEQDRPAIAVDNFLPMFPVLLAPLVVVLTPMHLAQMNGAADTATSAEHVVASLLTATAHSMGAVLKLRGLTTPPFNAEDHADKRAGLAGLQKQAWLQDARFTLVRPGLTRHVPLCEHGWLSADTRACLMASLAVIKPACVLELGSWYGLSSRLIVNSTAHCRLFAVDHYKNATIFEGARRKLSPSDKLFFNHPRFETFHANVGATLTERGAAKGNSVVMVQMDAMAAIERLRELGQEPQLVFIDCEKKTDALVKMIMSVRRCFPRAVIVGDDYVFPSVRRAVASFAQTVHVIALQEAYVLIPSGHDATPFRTSVSTVRATLAPSTAEAELERLCTSRNLNATQLERCVELCRELAATAKQDLLHTPVQYGRAERALHTLCRTRHPALRNHWDALFCDAASWTAPVHNSLALAPWDYLTNKIKFD